MNSNEVKQVGEFLDRVESKIAEPQQWCQHHYALTEHGTPVGYTSRHACRFCLSGAVGAVSMDDDISHQTALNAEKVLERTAGMTLPAFNDQLETQHSDVVELISQTRDNLANDPEFV